MRCRARLLASTLLLASAAPGLLPAHAAEPPRAPDASCGGNGPRVEITWLGSAAPEALQRAVCDWFRDEPWRVHFSPAGGPSNVAGAALHVTVQLESPSSARLHVQASRERAWTHEVTLPGPLDAAGIEVIAQSLHSSVQAASERTAPPPAASPRPAPPTNTSSAPATTATTPGDADLARATAPTAARATPAPTPGDTDLARATPPTAARATPAPTPGDASPAQPEPRDGDPAPLSSDGALDAGARPRPTPRASAGPTLPVHTGLGYLAFWRGDEPLLHGPALRIAVDASRRAPALGGFFRAALFTSPEHQSAGLALRSTGTSLAAGATLTTPLPRPLRPLTARAALGGGVDLLALDVRVTDPTQLRLTSERRARPRPFVAAEAGAAWQTGPIELELTLLLRWQLLHTTYEVQSPSDLRSVVIEPWRLQPGASLAAAYVW